LKDLAEYYIEHSPEELENITLNIKKWIADAGKKKITKYKIP
jgi:hypothetical protein